MGDREERRKKSLRNAVVVVDATITTGGPTWKCGPSEKHAQVENIPRGKPCPSCGRRLLEG